MNKFLSRGAILSVGLALAMGVGVAVGSKKASVAKADDVEVEIAPEDAGWSSAQEAQAGVEYESITLSTTKGTYNTQLRVYGAEGATFTVSCSAGDMTSISYTVSRGNFTSTDVGTFNAGTKSWSGESDSVTFSCTEQVRVTGVTVHYNAGGPVVTKYTVTYDANGGTVSPTSEKVVENEHPSMPTPIRAGYDFVGWRINGEGGEFADDTFVVTENVTLVADWLEQSSAGSVTIDLTAQGFKNQDVVTTVTSNPFTLTFSKGAGSNDPKWYDSGESVRTYASNTMTVATSGEQNIIAIEFVLGNTRTATPTVNVGTYNSATQTWAGSAKSITFTNANSGQFHYKEVIITTEVEPIPGYTAEEFAQQLLEATADVCADYDGHTNNKPYLMPIWAELAGATRYAGLIKDEQDLLVAADADEEGSTIERAMARYDYLTGKYGLTNFISGRTPVAFASSYAYDELSNNLNGGALVIVITASVSGILAFGILMLIKKKKQK